MLGTTGTFAGFDAPQSAGLKTVVAEVNKDGGILGHKLIYVNINDNSQTTKFGPAMQQLLQEHKYLAVFPTPVGFLTQMPYTNAEKIITFGGQTPVQTDFTAAKYPYNFNDSPLSTSADRFTALALQKWAGTKPVKVGIVVNSLTASEVQMTVVSKDLKAQGVTVLPIQTVAPTVTDVSLQLSQLQQGGANVIYSFSTDTLCTAAFQGLQTLAWKVRILGSANCLEPGGRQDDPFHSAPPGEVLRRLEHNAHNQREGATQARHLRQATACNRPDSCCWHRRGERRRRA